MNKTVKILTSVLTIALLVSVMIPSMVMATNGVVDNLFNQNAQGTEGIQTVGGRIVSVITTIGIVVAVVVLLILGIKYMMGSASEKAEYKKTMIPYLVGAVLIFGASAIAKAVISMTTGLTST